MLQLRHPAVLTAVFTRSIAEVVLVKNEQSSEIDDEERNLLQQGHADVNTQTARFLIMRTHIGTEDKRGIS